MKIKNLTNRKEAPCAKCPYKLGMVSTLVNPCPQCELNGYESYEKFLRLPYMHNGKGFADRDK